MGDLDVGVDIIQSVEVVTARRVMGVATEEGVACVQIRGQVTSSSKFKWCTHEVKTFSKQI